MLTIRVRRKKNKRVFVSHMLEIIVIEKGKALYSRSQKCILGTYNKKTNSLLLNLDKFYYWLGQGSSMTTAVYFLLRSFIF